MKNASAPTRHAAAPVLALALLIAGAFPVHADNADNLLRKMNDSLAMSYDRPVTSNQTDSIRTALGENPTVDDYLTLAEHRNPELRAAFYRWRADIKKTGYAGALPDPMISYGYFIEQVETRVGPQEQRLSLHQSIPWFGTLGASKQMAREAAGASYQKFEAARLRLVYTVRKAYYDYWYLGREIQLTKDNLELLKFWESVVRTKYTVALRQHPDVIKAQVELGKLDDQLKSLRDQLEPARAKLRAALNLDDSLALPIPTAVSEEELALDRDSLIGELRTSNPNLKAIEHVRRKAEAAARLAGKSSYPNFNFGVDYIVTGEAMNPSTPESGKDPLMVSVGINLPIWFGKNGARRSEARARERAARYTFESAREDLTAYASSVMYKYEDAVRRKKLYRDGLVPKAEQSLNATYAAYQAGDFDFLNVLDAQRQLLEFQLQLDRSTADVAINRAEIEMLLGRELKDTDRE